MNHRSGPEGAETEGDERSGPGRSLHPPWSFRSHDLSRVFALSDGIFAFSMTLLVLSLALPAGTHGPGVRTYLLSSAFLSSLYAYAITFFVIYAWWRAHNLAFSYIRAYDQRLAQLNIVFLLFIAVLPFATDALNASAGDPAGVIFFAGVEVVTGVALGSLWTYAWTGGHLTDPALPRSWARHLTMTIFSVPAVFAVSIAVAFVNVSWAEYLWALMFVMPFLAGRLSGARRESSSH